MDGDGAVAELEPNGGELGDGLLIGEDGWGTIERADEGVATLEGGLVAVIVQAELELLEMLAEMVELAFGPEGVEALGGVEEALSVLLEAVLEGFVEAILEVIEAEVSFFDAIAWVIGFEVGFLEGEAMLFVLQLVGSGLVEPAGEVFPSVGEGEP